jgi:diamine N-acetyltransferase
MEISIKSKSHETFIFRHFKQDDADILGEFFESLSDNTRSKFGPHPLTAEYASSTLCKTIGTDNVVRYVIASTREVIGYFILDFSEYPHERERYLNYGINLDFSCDPVFAPCISDKHQNQGIASLAMNAMLQIIDRSKVKSLVLMGGTQEPNVLARNFYKKFGFKELGEFHTDHNGLNNVDMRLVF